MTNRHRTRREALGFIGAGAAGAWGWPALASMASMTGAGTAPGPGMRTPRLRYFDLHDVRLGEGPFLAAQRRDAAYLLRLEPDRMLHNFRVNAGLAPKAPVYGGWESMEPWVDIRCHGHTLGHYLTACACMYAASGDQAFAARVDYIVDELAQCQRNTGGWLTAFPDGVAPLADSLAGKAFAGVPWYTTHKVLAGLRDAHLIRGGDAALEVLTKFARWIDAAAAPVSDAALQIMLDREHGGMNEVLADVCVLTGDGRYLDLARRFSHRKLLEPLARGEDPLDGQHANTQIPKVIGFSRIHQLGGPAEFGTAAAFFWSTVVRTRTFATGGHGDGEHFFPPRDFGRHLSSAKTMETCCTHNMMRLTRALHAQDPQSSYFNYFERALFNGILASQDPDSGMMTYFQATRPGYVKLFHTPFDSFWCCTGSGMENHARYGESLYAHDDESLYVNLFVASTLEWRERQLTLTQSTRFPDEERTTLQFSGQGPQELALRIRHPAWCERMKVSVNGKSAGSSTTPGSYYTLPVRRFRPGDRVEVHLPMRLRLEPLPGAPAGSSEEWAAMVYGPIVLAGVLGKVDPAAQIIVNERKSGEMLNDAVSIPAWPRPLAELPAHFTRTRRDRLTFIAAGFTGGPVKFIPWFRVAHERYNLYWRGG
jgi:DUF1680 family protein